MDRRMEEDICIFLINHLFKESFIIMIYMEREYTNGQMEECIKESGAKIRWKDMERPFGRIINLTRENFYKTKR